MKESTLRQQQTDILHTKSYNTVYYQHVDNKDSYSKAKLTALVRISGTH